jgi:hypothetical protein
MSSLAKSSSGLLFSEKFDGDISLLWDLSPNNQDRVVQNNDSISLLQGNEDIELLIPIPTENQYVVQSKIAYTPGSQDDKAGILLRSVTDSVVNFEVCGDDSIICTNMKTCIDEYGILYAYASSDNGTTWKNYGNTKLVNMNNLGFYNYGKNKELKIYDCIMYKNNYVTFNNFDRTTYIKLFQAGVEITNDFDIKKYNTRIVLDCIDKLFPLNNIEVKVYNRSDNKEIAAQVFNEIYGGDIYEFNYNLEFKINNDILDSEKMYDLGKISSDTIFNLIVTNKEPYSIIGKSLKVTYHSLLNRAYEYVDIAEETSDKYYKSIEASFTPGESKIFKLKITKDVLYSEINSDYEFSIILE